jgi:predicted Zn-dependent protease with MMP-like domain
MGPVVGPHYPHDEHHSMPQNPIVDPLAWRAVTAPSLADFEILATEVYRGLPTKFRTLCEDLVIRIEDFATGEVLDDMNIGDPFDLLGLFQVGLPFRAESAPLHMPNEVFADVVPRKGNRAKRRV